MQPALLDSSLYISATRRGGDLASWGEIADAPSWLSAVVLEELYAGATASSYEGLRKLEREFREENRVLVPNDEDWADAGRVLNRVAAKYGYEEIGRGRLANDALIAVSGGRMGILVMTANARDFQRLAEFRSFAWRYVEA